MTQHQAVNDGVRELKPCPWCQQRLELVESWAKSFDPPRLYREYHHRAEPECILGKRLWAFPEDAEKARQAFIAAWNTRALDPVLADMREALEEARRELSDGTGARSASEQLRQYGIYQRICAALSRSERKDGE